MTEGNSEVKLSEMHSLPSGWHGIPVPSKSGMSPSVKASTLPTPIRKKWNSPMSSSEMPRSKLPAYKPLNSRPRKNPTGSAPDVKLASKSSGSQSELSSAKAAVTKELQNEISKLKKELATVKTENSILKVKVRRVDDENIQKSRQIDKLRIELKSAQKVDSTSSKKSKDSELLLLRQKCLRLEGALKEKDLSLNTFRKLNIESLKMEGAKTKQNGTCSELGDADETKQDNLNETQTLSKSSFTAHSRPSQSSKSEVAKLRDMIHKLEKQNQDLEQQVKDKGEEIRCLKSHLRSQTYIKTPKTSAPSFSSKTNISSSISKTSAPVKISSSTITSKSSIPNGVSKNSIPNGISKSSIPNGISKSSIPNGIPKSSSTKISSKPPSTDLSSKVSQLQTSLKKTNKVTPIVPNNTNIKKNALTATVNGVPRKELKAPVAEVKNNSKAVARMPKKPLDSSIKKDSTQQKPVKVIRPPKQTNGEHQPKESILNTTQTLESSILLPSSSETEKPAQDLDIEAQKLRENIAAKKIQRGWRNHQKKHQNGEDDEKNANLRKAMTFIVTSIKHHKSRKEKLNTLRKRKNLTPRLKVENENVLVEAIQTATKSLWTKELNAAN
ncbi:hypothetical protein JTE90_019033 [Oedothorax gibbosus]|uniref:Uncharacterized protein n=1 Tax=Oedothorax gibbosus TaxID=931172 RepID=A0AAV6V0C7_9ARAC|nr:hypothetical protein JTE90_019033 [Oedothorax gibbosus]